MNCLRIWKISLFIIVGTFVADIIIKLPNTMMATLLGLGTGALLTSVACMYDIKRIKKDM